MRTVKLILICLTLSAALSADDTLDWQLKAAVKLWLALDQDVRIMAGCPLRGEFGAIECRNGHTDYQAFLKGRKLAMRYYGLRD